MPTVNLGKVGMTLKGVYDNEAQYEKLDVVYYDDSTYCAKVSTKGNTPSKEDDTYWQLLVAPNPLATWKPNTKDDEGYVQKGDGHTDSLWATDSAGNPAWVKKSDVATKVGKNTSTNDGIVTKGSGHYNKAWTTDNDGDPDWREYSRPSPNTVIDLSKWKSDYIGAISEPGHEDDFLFLFAKIEVAPNSEYREKYQLINFDMYDSAGMTITKPNKLLLMLANHTRGSDPSSKISVAMAHTNNAMPHYPKVWCVFKCNESTSNQTFYLGISYYNLPSTIYINNLQKTSDISIEWLTDNYNNYYDDACYINVPRSKTDSAYQYYQYNVVASHLQLPVPNVTTDISGLVPAPTSEKSNYVFSTNAVGKPEWHDINDLGIPTSEQVQEAISAAIASADFSSFEIVDTEPTPETAKENKFYLVKNEKTQHYDIYAKIGEQIEWIDDTAVDLTEYAKIEQVPTNVSELANDKDYTSLTDEQYNALIQLLGEE